MGLLLECVFRMLCARRCHNGGLGQGFKAQEIHVATSRSVTDSAGPPSSEYLPSISFLQKCLQFNLRKIYDAENCFEPISHILGHEMHFECPDQYCTKPILWHSCSFQMWNIGWWASPSILYRVCKDAVLFNSICFLFFLPCLCFSGSMEWWVRLWSK